MPYGVTSAGSKDKDITVRLLTTFKRLISEGTLKLGTRLPAERELAETLQVSRNSLRQALKVLEIMGVISQRVGDGTYINSAASSMLGEPLEFLVLLNGISFEELMEARCIVEPELAARAATRAVPRDWAALRHEMEAMKASGDSAALVSQHDLEFHKIIFDAAGSRVCSMLFTVVHRSLNKLIEMTSQLVSVDHTLAFHERIYTAIVQGSAEDARKRMAEHLQDVTLLLSGVHEKRQRSSLQTRFSELAVASPSRSRARKR